MELFFSFRHVCSCCYQRTPSVRPSHNGVPGPPLHDGGDRTAGWAVPGISKAGKFMHTMNDELQITIVIMNAKAICYVYAKLLRM